MNLGEYLQAAASRPWHWSRHDCCTYLAGWVVDRGHSDPMAFIRGKYRTGRGAMRRIKEGGGLLQLATYGMIDAGIPEADEPQTGDVGIIERPTEDGLNEACAIYSSGKWVSLGVRGLDAGPAVALAVWRP